MVEEEDVMGSLDVVGMFSNIPVKMTWDVVRGELEYDDALKLKRKENDTIQELSNNKKEGKKEKIWVQGVSLSIADTNLPKEIN